MIGGQATRTWISLRPAVLPNPLQQDLQRRRADDRILHQQYPLAFQDLAERRVLGFRLALAGRRRPSMNVRPL
jgi:hypothetical protein